MTALRLGTALVVALMCAGCGVKTAYNNLDRLIVWAAKDFVDFDAQQTSYLKAELDVLLFWHRTTQLPLYADGLRALERDVRRGVDLETVVAMESKVKQWGESLTRASVPLAAELLYSLSDPQIIELEAGFEADNLEYLEPYEGVDGAARVALWAEEFGDAFAFMSGRLSKDQVHIIERYGERYRPDDLAWLDYRRRWQAAVVNLIRERKSYEAFELGYQDMALNRERFYGDAYRALFEHNESMYRDLTVELLRALTDKQKDRFSDRLLGIAEDFEQLVAVAKPVGPPAACLVTCRAAVSAQ